MIYDGLSVPVVLLSMRPIYVTGARIVQLWTARTTGTDVATLLLSLFFLNVPQQQCSVRVAVTTHNNCTVERRIS